eukprot:5638341-Pyramimonas_sp.AAC.1
MQLYHVPHLTTGMLRNLHVKYTRIHTLLLRKVIHIRYTWYGWYTCCIPARAPPQARADRAQCTPTAAGAASDERRACSSTAAPSMAGPPPLPLRTPAPPPHPRPRHKEGQQMG